MSRIRNTGISGEKNEVYANALTTNKRKEDQLEINKWKVIT